MSKINVVENITDLQFKLGEFFESEHIKIKNDNMYVSKSFAKYLIKQPFKEYVKHCSNMYHTKYGVKYRGFYTHVVIRDIMDNGVIKYLVAGSCGSHGFGGMQHTQSETLGVMVRRVVNKMLVDTFLESPLNRLAKIKKIMKRSNETISGM